MRNEYTFDISNIIEAGVNGDTDTVRAYADQFVKHLKENGDAETAKTIRQCLRPSRAKKVSLARSLAKDIAIPVCSESQMPLADAEFPEPDSVRVFLKPEVQVEVDRFINFFHAADRLAESGVGISPSMLIHGPPGCGKTLLARHIAAELEMPLITARTDGLISSYLGSTAKSIRLLFEHAASMPCVLFLDEFDALAKMRDDERELGELKRVVISLLQNIDALGHEHVILAATNHDHLLDPAIWRRFSFTIHLTEPDFDERSAMLVEFFGKFADELTIETVAAIGGGLTGAQLKQIAENAIRDAILADQERPSISDIVAATITANPEFKSNDEPLIETCTRLLRKANPKRFTQNKIAQLFEVSQTTIHRLLKTV